MISADNLLEDRITKKIVVGLILFLFAIANLPWHLDNYDQAKQAYTSFEMVNAGHWFYQHTPNEKVATKPPLVGWISALLFQITRSWGVAWRLPSFLAAVVILVLLHRSTAQAYGTAAGLIAASAFGLNLLSVRLATLVRTDMPLALVVFLLGLQIWEKIRRGQPWQKEDRIFTFALLTTAMLIKGPIVYAFLLPGIVIYQWRRRGDCSGASAWCGWWPWIASFAVFLLWVIGGLFVPNFFDEVVVREFAGRFDDTEHRPQPSYFYLPHLLHKFAPWSILGIALVILKLAVEKVRLRDWWRRGSPETVWLVCWSLGGLLIMSLIPSKRVDRIFPVIAPFCLLLAALVARSWAQERLRERTMSWCCAALILACVFSAGYAIWKVSMAYREQHGALASFGRAVRLEAQAHGWRYDVIGRRHEGMLLYLERLRFAKPEEVITRWNTAAIDAVIAPEEERLRLLRDLEGSIPSRIRSWKKNDDRIPRYILLTRSQPAR
jgi:4-amino-4-deoxy-L-arabinose transferase-like glycosyltransferase